MWSRYIRLWERNRLNDLRIIKLPVSYVDASMLSRSMQIELLNINLFRN